MKSLYFEYSSKEREIFKQLIDILHKIDIKIEGGNFKAVTSFIEIEDKNTNKIITRIDIDGFFEKHILTDNEKIEKMDKIVEEQIEVIGGYVL